MQKIKFCKFDQIFFFVVALILESMVILYNEFRSHALFTKYLNIKNIEHIWKIEKQKNLISYILLSN